MSRTQKDEQDRAETPARAKVRRGIGEIVTVYRNGGRMRIMRLRGEVRPC